MFLDEVLPIASLLSVLPMQRIDIALFDNSMHNLYCNVNLSELHPVIFPEQSLNP